MWLAVSDDHLALVVDGGGTLPQVAERLGAAAGV